jgi:hypothetical protein
MTAEAASRMFDRTLAGTILSRALAGVQHYAAALQREVNDRNIKISDAALEQARMYTAQRRRDRITYAIIGGIGWLAAVALTVLLLVR